MPSSYVPCGPTCWQSTSQTSGNDHAADVRHLAARDAERADDRKHRANQPKLHPRRHRARCSTGSPRRRPSRPTRKSARPRHADHAEHVRGDAWSSRGCSSGRSASTRAPRRSSTGRCRRAGSTLAPDQSYAADANRNVTHRQEHLAGHPDDSPGDVEHRAGQRQHDRRRPDRRRRMSASTIQWTERTSQDRTCDARTEDCSPVATGSCTAAGFFYCETVTTGPTLRRVVQRPRRANAGSNFVTTTCSSVSTGPTPVARLHRTGRQRRQQLHRHHLHHGHHRSHRGRLARRRLRSRATATPTRPAALRPAPGPRSLRAHRL